MNNPFRLSRLFGLMARRPSRSLYGSVAEQRSHELKRERTAACFEDFKSELAWHRLVLKIPASRYYYLVVFFAPQLRRYASIFSETNLP